MQQNRAWIRGASLSSVVGLPAASIVAIVSPPYALADTEVTSCGQEVRGKAFLSSDLDCTGTAAAAVVIQYGKLDLRGFTIFAGDSYGVGCRRRCTIFGGGTIEGAGLDGVLGFKSVRIIDTTIRRSSARGVDVEGNVRIEDSTIVENLNDGVSAGKNARIKRSTISDNGCPAWAGPSYCSELAPPFPDGIDCPHRGTARVSDSTVSGNAFGGITATGRVKATNVVALGNSFHATCHVSVHCGDIESGRKPRVKDTVCDRSTAFGLPEVPWGVCALD